MNELGRFLLWGAAIWVGYRLVKAQQEGRVKVTLQQPLPPGAKPTGEIRETATGAPPGEEVVGYGIRQWAEILLPNGYKQWVPFEIEEEAE